MSAIAIYVVHHMCGVHMYVCTFVCMHMFEYIN